MEKIYDFFYKINIGSILNQNALNNRELAYLTIIFIGIFFLFTKIKKKRNILIRLKNIIKIIFSKEILGVIIILNIWVVLNCYILNRINIWNWSLLKSTLIWFITTGIFITFKVVDMNNLKVKQYLKSIVRDSLKITIILDFIQNVYIFNYWIELGIVIIILIFGLLKIAIDISNDKKEKSINDLEKVINIIINTVIIFWLMSLFFEVITKPKALIDLNNLREFITNIILNISMIIPTYFLWVYVAYDNIFRHLKVRGNLNDSEKRYIRFKIIIYAKLNLNKLDIKMYQNIFWLSNKNDIKKAFKDLKRGIYSVSI